VRHLQTLLAAQTQLRQAAEGQARESRHELTRLAEALCPEEVDRLRCGSPQGLDLLSPREIADMVLAGVKGRLQAAAPAGSSAPAQRCAEAEARLAELERNRCSVERRAAHAGRAQTQRCHSCDGAGVAPSAEADSLEARHGETRAGLVRAAADLLAAAGYEVNSLPARLPLSGGEAFAPDLTVELADGLQPVEVEDLSRPVSVRERRWEAGCALARNRLCFVAPTAQALEALRSEVFYWAGTRPLQLWMTDLQRGRGRLGEGLWLVQRRQS